MVGRVEQFLFNATLLCDEKKEDCFYWRFQKVFHRDFYVHATAIERINVQCVLRTLNE